MVLGCRKREAAISMELWRRGGEGACLHVAQGARVDGEDVDNSTDQKPKNNGDERLGHGAQSSHGGTHYAYEDGAE